MCEAPAEETKLDVAAEQKFGEQYAAIVAELLELMRHAHRMLRRAGPPIGQNSRRHVEAACLSIRRSCEYLAVAVVLAHHWDGHPQPNLMAWKPKELLASVASLSEHPMPAPIADVRTHEAIQMTALPLDVVNLVRLYGQCSNLIHVGRPDRLVDGKLPAYDLVKMERVIDEFSQLALAHVLLLPGIQKVIIWDGRIKHALIAESPGEGKLSGMTLPSLGLNLYDGN